MIYPNVRSPGEVSRASFVVRNNADPVPSIEKEGEEPKGYLAALAEVRRTPEGHILLVGLGRAATRIREVGPPTSVVPVHSLRSTHPSLKSLPHLYPIAQPSRPVYILGQRYDYLSVRLRPGDPSFPPNPLHPKGRVEATQAIVPLLQQIGIHEVSVARLPGGDEVDITFAPDSLDVSLIAPETLSFHGVEARDIAMAGTRAALAAASAVPAYEQLNLATLPGFTGRISAS